MLYENFTILRVYVFEEESYKLPSFLKPRVFSIKYVKKSFMANQIHFKHQINFMLPKELGPFLVKVFNSLQYMEEFMKHLNLEKLEKGSYDPH